MLTLTNHNYIDEEVKGKQLRECQNLLSSSILSKNLKIKIIRTLSVLYKCETFVSHTERGTYAVVFKNRVLRKIFGTKRDKVTENLRRLHN
jgi:hypothetical protein